VIFVVVLFTGPLLVFTGKLLREWCRGITEYGSLARTPGQQFERKWFNPALSVEEQALRVPDFSAVTDLYQFVSNVYRMRVIPVDLKSVVSLIIVTLLPLLLVTLLSVPLDVIFARFANLCSKCNARRRFRINATEARLQASRRTAL
jgi:hypothetical protein